MMVYMQLLQIVSIQKFGCNKKEFQVTTVCSLNLATMKLFSTLLWLHEQINITESTSEPGVLSQLTLLNPFLSESGPLEQQEQNMGQEEEIHQLHQPEGPGRPDAPNNNEPGAKHMITTRPHAVHTFSEACVCVCQ